MNKYYQKFKEPAPIGGRDFVFQWAVSEILEKIKEPHILSIGAIRNLDVNSRAGDGWADFYWCELLARKGCGSLTIVDISQEAIENCQVILSDFKDRINIKFVVDDGRNWTDKKYDFYYLDGGDADWQTFEMFKKIDLRNGHVLLDDAGWGGKVDRIKHSYPFFNLIQVNEIHQMVYFSKMENYGNTHFKIGSLNLPYYRGWKGNREATNNRAVEISLIQWFTNKYKKDFKNIIEIGDVSPAYEIFDDHKILDPFGPYLKSIRKDVLDCDYNDKRVVSVSTWEHFSEAAYGNSDKEKPIKALYKVAQEAKSWLISFDIGGDRYFEDWLMKQNDFKYTFLVRGNDRGLINNWYQSDDKECFYYDYLHWELEAGLYGNAKAICVLSSEKEIFNAK